MSTPAWLFNQTPGPQADNLTVQLRIDQQSNLKVFRENTTFTGFKRFSFCVAATVNIGCVRLRFFRVSSICTRNEIDGSIFLDYYQNAPLLLLIFAAF